uniref:Uncharacterized protein n=1 Tax=Chromera velia CCMP2878 TaxID=1169474 RepID=A0A0G4HRA1_9ALVE|eukprot:Cvel_30559.t1-p1 / transcript=Cvel_30559.t1 / gene=Cvel_30559 / organism=Chromera_velia_CCMP2878 / gene_product=hypothetical protein / transcript_product=hypothetical protein / location=Cvel_scaffold4375:2830-3831(+) / protein_length=334 / sequence_SO=supercontig / SO=protein_coding / is_pseudo=false
MTEQEERDAETNFLKCPGLSDISSDEEGTHKEMLKDRKKMPKQPALTVTEGAIERLLRESEAQTEEKLGGKIQGLKDSIEEMGEHQRKMQQMVNDHKTRLGNLEKGQKRSAKEKVEEEKRICSQVVLRLKLPKKDIRIHAENFIYTAVLDPNGARKDTRLQAAAFAETMFQAFQGVMSMNHQSWGSMKKMVFSAETVARDFDSLFNEQNNMQHPETGDQLRCVIPRTREQTDAAMKKWAVGVMGDAASSDQKKEEARKALQRLAIPLSQQPQPRASERDGDLVMGGTERDGQQTGIPKPSPRIEQKGKKRMQEQNGSAEQQQANAGGEASGVGR